MLNREEAIRGKTRSYLESKSSRESREETIMEVVIETVDQTILETTENLDEEIEEAMKGKTAKEEGHHRSKKESRLPTTMGPTSR